MATEQRVLDVTDATFQSAVIEESKTRPVVACGAGGGRNFRIGKWRGHREACGGAVDGITVFPSGANFVLLRVVSGRSVWDALVERGVLVRDCSSWPGLDDCLRVTIGTPEENDAFLEALPASIAASTAASTAKEKA